MPQIIARLSVLLLIVVLALAATRPAMAHVQLLSSHPGANAVLAQAPPVLQLVFNEPVSPLVITLIAPDGATSDLTENAVGGATLNVHLPGDLAGGTHVLSWRVVSVDAHPVAGSLVFSIGAASMGAIPEITTGSGATTILLWASKTLLFATLFFGVGGAVFTLVSTLPAPGRRPTVMVVLAGLVMAPLSLGLHGADALGLPPDAILSASTWMTGLSTSYGITVLLLVAALVLALSCLVLRPVLAWPAWLLAALSLAISGHAGAADPQWLTRAAVTLHVAGILFWAGALLPLWLWLRQRNDAADRALARFSRFIPFAVAAILVSGVVLAIIQLGVPGEAWLSPYGYILAAKLVFLVVLFGLAAWNRFRLTRPALAGHIAARYHLRYAILAEIALVLAILALAAGWRFTPPPRAIAAAEAAQAALLVPAYAHAMDDRVMADIVVTPGRAGPVAVDIMVIDSHGAPLEPASVALTMGSPALGIEPFTANATLVDGIWRVQDQVLPQPGPWELILTIRLDRFTQSRIGAEIDLD